MQLGYGAKLITANAGFLDSKYGRAMFYFFCGSMAGSPRSGIRAAPLERTRTQLYSAVFRWVHCTRSPSSSRGALNTLHSAVLPPPCWRIPTQAGSSAGSHDAWLVAQIFAYINWGMCWFVGILELCGPKEKVRSGEIRGDSGRSGEIVRAEGEGEIWGDPGRSGEIVRAEGEGEIWGDLGRFGELCVKRRASAALGGDLGRSGEIWGDLGRRRRALVRSAPHLHAALFTVVFLRVGRQRASAAHGVAAAGKQPHALL